MWWWGFELCLFCITSHHSFIHSFIFHPRTPPLLISYHHPPTHNNSQPSPPMSQYNQQQPPPQGTYVIIAFFLSAFIFLCLFISQSHDLIYRLSSTIWGKGRISSARVSTTRVSTTRISATGISTARISTTRLSTATRISSTTVPSTRVSSSICSSSIRSTSTSSTCTQSQQFKQLWLLKRMVRTLIIFPLSCMHPCIPFILKSLVSRSAESDLVDLRLNLVTIVDYKYQL